MCLSFHYVVFDVDNIKISTRKCIVYKIQSPRPGRKIWSSTLRKDQVDVSSESASVTCNNVCSWRQEEEISVGAVVVECPIVRYILLLDV